MRAFFAIAIVCFIWSCGPRDDEKFLNGGGSGGLGIKSGEIIKATNQGEKLSTCQGADDPTWNTIRLFEESSAIHDKIANLKVIVGKGSRNCVKISDQESVEIVLQDSSAEGGFARSGQNFFVEKIYLMNKADFINNRSLFKEAAEGMLMSENELSNFLNSGLQKEQVHLTFLKKGSSQPSEDSKVVYELPEGHIISIQKEGVKLPSCSSDKDPIWQNIQISPKWSQLYPSLDQLKVIVDGGTRNCLEVSTKKTVEVQTKKNDTDKKWQDSNSHYLIKKLVMIHTVDFLSDEKLLLEVATLLGVEGGTLIDLLNGSEFPETLTLTFVEASEEIADVKEYTYQHLSSDGELLSKCKNKWTDIRLSDFLNTQLAEALKSKQVTTLLTDGDFNCLQVGARAVFSHKVNDEWIKGDQPVQIKSITIRDKQQLLNDSVLRFYIASEMAMTEESFLSYLNELNEDQVNITRFEWVAAQ